MSVNDGQQRTLDVAYASLDDEQVHRPQECELACGSRIAVVFWVALLYGLVTLLVVLIVHDRARMDNSADNNAHRLCEIWILLQEYCGARSGPGVSCNLKGPCGSSFECRCVPVS